MKIQYTFNTESEDFDRTELAAVQQAQEMAYVLNQICELFRSWTKYNSFPRKQPVNKEDYILEGEQEYVDDLNAFIEKYPDVVPDVWEMRDEIVELINSYVDMEKLGY